MPYFKIPPNHYQHIAFKTDGGWHRLNITVQKGDCINAIVMEEDAFFVYAGHERRKKVLSYLEHWPNVRYLNTLVKLPAGEYLLVVESRKDIGATGTAYIYPEA